MFEDVPNWISLEYESDKYQGKKILDKDTIKYISESSGLMMFNGEEKLFALDGQHRVEGIKLALEKDRKKTGQPDILKDDQFSVILVGHIDTEIGRKRSRKLFSDINKNAKPVGRLDKIKIDEQDISAIVTRRIFANSKYFKDSGLIALSETSNLDKNDITHFANLATLDSVCKKLKGLHKKEKNIPEWDEINVLNFLKIVDDFYDFIFETIEEYRAFFITKTLTLSKAREENKYFLFRPIGLIMMAKLYRHFYHDLPYLKKHIKKVSFIMPASPLNKVVWTLGKMEARAKNQNLAFDLVCYLLNSFEEKKVAGLKKAYWEVTREAEGTQLPPKVV